MSRRRSFLTQAAVVVLLLAAEDARTGDPFPRLAPAERTLVAAARAGAEAQCDCAAAATHRAYLRCVSHAVKALAGGRLSHGGMRAAMRCAVRSTCGREGMVTCCRTRGNGRTHCAVIPAAKCVAPSGGSACVSSFASWCDAVDQGCAPLQGPQDINCCLPTSSPAGAFVCEPQKPSECTTAGGTDMGGDGSCVPDPCTGVIGTTTTTVPPLCGNDTIDPGEECDPPWSRTCPARGPGHIQRECQDDCRCPSTATTTTSTVVLTTTTATGPSTTVTSTSTSTSTTAVGTTTSTSNTAIVTTTSTSSTVVVTTTSTSNTAVVTTTSSTTTSTTGGGCGDCCTSGLTQIKTLNGLPSLSTVSGHVLDGSGANLLDLKAGGLYFGGAGNTVPVPSLVPDTVDTGGQGGTWTKVASCSAGSFTIAATNTTDLSTFTHPNRHCSSAGVTNPEYPGLNGCLFGPPLAIPNAASPTTSTCVINRVSTTASGSGSCNGDTTLSLPLASDIYLTGPTSGLSPCPLCTGGTCSGGPNNGQPCMPESDVIPGQTPAANPTSHDCPPAAGSNIGFLPIPFNLSTGTQAKTSAAQGTGAGASFVFCGFCGQQFAPTFQGPPAHACTSNSDCTTGAFTKCRQRSDGAFDSAMGGTAKTITETGTAPGCLTDGAVHPINLVSVFCIPPSFNATVDGAADLPGPGAVSLPGSTQLVP